MAYGYNYRQNNDRASMRELDDLEGLYDEYPSNTIYNNTRTAFNSPKMMLERKLRECEEKKLDYLVLDNLDIKEIPEILSTYDWVTKLEINNTGISELKNLPPNLISLSAKSNQIETFDQSKFGDKLQTIDLTNNMIREISDIHDIFMLSFEDNLLYAVKELKNVTYLTLKNNHLKDLPKFDGEIKGLDISKNFISNIDELPDSLEYLGCDELGQLEIIGKFPASLKQLKASGCRIKKIPNKFPVFLEEIDISDNYLESILPEYSPNLKKIDASKNKLQFVRPLPPWVEKLIITDNNIHVCAEHIKSDSRVEGDFNRKVLTLPVHNTYNNNGYHPQTNSNYSTPSYSYNYNGYNNNNNNTTYSSSSTTGYTSYYESGKYTKKNPNYIIHKKEVTI
jgi:hypothetical protein